MPTQLFGSLLLIGWVVVILLEIIGAFGRVVLPLRTAAGGRADGPRLSSWAAPFELGGAFGSTC